MGPPGCHHISTMSVMSLAGGGAAPLSFCDTVGLRVSELLATFFLLLLFTGELTMKTQTYTRFRDHAMEGE